MTAAGRALAVLLVVISAACGGNPSGPDDEPVRLTYNTSVSSRLVYTGAGCTHTYGLAGPIVIIVDDAEADTISGTIQVSLNTSFQGATNTSSNPQNQCGEGPGVVGGWNATFRGPQANLSGQITNSAPGSPSNVLSFSGALSGRRITGTLRISVTGNGASGSVDFPISLDPL